MNEELTRKLLADFPYLYRDHHTSSMQNGFVCGDGWFGLIYKLSQDIEFAARESGMNLDSPEWPMCRQVKEKLGALRFVVFAIDGFPELSERLGEIRHAAYVLSLEICERCGKHKAVVVDKAISPICPECALKSGNAISLGKKKTI